MTAAPAFRAVDWALLLFVAALLAFGALYSRRYMRSVADFLAAGRTAGRYLISVSLGMSMLGAITVVGEFEVFYRSGFVLKWWELFMAVAILVVTVSGWVYYRFRQTRSLTLAQFFEVRYSRPFRVFAGLLAFVSGIINFGIFPAVAARFFLAYLDIPRSVSLAGWTVGTYPLIMALLLAAAIALVFLGGQVSVIITDFLQGVFCNVVFMAMIAWFLVKLPWGDIAAGLGAAPAGASLVNPFRAGAVEHFNFWYFVIGLVGFVYNTMSWQGTQAYNASAKSAHESKMAQVLGNWRNYPRNLFLMFIPVAAYAVLHLPRFAATAANVEAAVAAAGSPEVQSQLRVPLVLRHILPTGFVGAFAAIMLSAFISNSNAYLHSWGSIFIQDVIMPFRRRPFAPKTHLRVLKGSVFGVAAFIFLFSLLFRQTQHIYLFFAITGAIFVGGSGAVIVGGLYWKRGTAAGAWSAMITGAVVSVAGIVLNQVFPGFPVDGQWFWGIAMVSASLVYVVVSLAGPRREFDLDRLLRRGSHAVAGETAVVDAAPARGWKVMGMGREFTRGDRLIYILSYAWILAWTLVFLAGTLINLGRPASDAAWARYWSVYVYVFAAVSGVVVVWLSVGGFRDLRSMLKALAVARRDERDDGFVRREPGAEPAAGAARQPSAGDSGAEPGSGPEPGPAPEAP